MYIWENLGIKGLFFSKFCNFKFSLPFQHLYIRKEPSATVPPSSVVLPPAELSTLDSLLGLKNSPLPDIKKKKKIGILRIKETPFFDKKKPIFFICALRSWDFEKTHPHLSGLGII